MQASNTEFNSKGRGYLRQREKLTKQKLEKKDRCNDEDNNIQGKIKEKIQKANT